MDSSHPDRQTIDEARIWSNRLEELGMLPVGWKEPGEIVHINHQNPNDYHLVTIDFDSNSNFRDASISYSQPDTSFIVSFSYRVLGESKEGVVEIFSKMRADKFRKWILEKLDLDLELAGDTIASGRVYNATSQNGMVHLAVLLQQPTEDDEQVWLEVSLSYDPEPIDLRSEKFAESKFDDVRAMLASLADAAAILAKYLSSFARGMGQHPFMLENGMWEFMIESTDSALKIKTPAEYPTQKAWLEMKYAVRALPGQLTLSSEDRKVLFMNVLKKYNLPTDLIQTKGDLEVIELAPGVNFVHESTIVGGQINCTLTLSLLALNSAERILKKTQLAG